MDTQALRRRTCIIAADVPNLAAARGLLAQTQMYFDWYKVGLQLFLAEGHAVVDIFKQAGKRVFLDLKLHDIPATVGKAAEAVARLEPDLLTVHASGGREMVQAAVKALGDRTQVIAVTVLTSLSPEDAQRLWHGSPASLAQRWLIEPQAGGAAGFVCSPHEVRDLKAIWPQGRAVVPGIRFGGAGAGDQKRIATPASALRDGADWLVIGRPITEAPDLGAAVAALDADLAAL